MKPIQFLLLSVLLITACRTSKMIPSRTVIKTVKDSTFTTLQVMDTIHVLRAADTAQLRLPIDQLTTIPVVTKSKQAIVSLRRIKDTVVVDCECQALKTTVKQYKATIHRQKEVITELQDTQTLIQNRMTFIQKLFFYIGLITAGLLTIGLLVRRAYRHWRLVKP